MKTVQRRLLHTLPFIVRLAAATVECLPVEVVVVRDQLLVVDVGKMTYIDKIKIAEVFASPTVNERNRLESHKEIGIENELSSLTAPHVVPPATIAYISLVDSESSGNKMHQAVHSNLA
ncbi:hypothetical protein J1N35_000836 [Gossypium stocksii]|uniref:Uncharacterized protein n=1 Tax=Gossypium stocksii TaxID=47602 RepID=A0A9D3WJ36_9ROSI|nr:hypothetical protein J1N35_000836 [Gossypium stocksii]